MAPDDEGEQKEVRCGMLGCGSGCGRGCCCRGRGGKSGSGITEMAGLGAVGHGVFVVGLG